MGLNTQIIPEILLEKIRRMYEILRIRKLGVIEIPGYYELFGKLNYWKKKYQEDINELKEQISSLKKQLEYEKEKDHNKIIKNLIKRLDKKLDENHILEKIIEEIRNHALIIPFINVDLLIEKIRKDIEIKK